VPKKLLWAIARDLMMFLEYLMLGRSMTFLYPRVLDCQPWKKLKKKKKKGVKLVFVFKVFHLK
jgi:hypothetical protein